MSSPSDDVEDSDGSEVSLVVCVCVVVSVVVLGSLVVVGALVVPAVLDVCEPASLPSERDTAKAIPATRSATTPAVKSAQSHPPPRRGGGCCGAYG